MSEVASCIAAEFAISVFFHVSQSRVLRLILIFGRIVIDIAQH
jgi:hypothetical protein